VGASPVPGFALTVPVRARARGAHHGQSPDDRAELHEGGALATFERLPGPLDTVLADLDEMWNGAPAAGVPEAAPAIAPPSGELPPAPGPSERPASRSP
jgi:hypothetical protein